MNDVFISYSRRNKDFTQKLYAALIAANRTIWADWDSIPAASDWFAEIKQGIEQTNSVLFVLSSEWLKSNECRKELTYAVEMGKRLFPILYEPVNPNDVPPELAKINWVYMRDTDDFEKAFQTLCAAMDTDLDWIKTHTRIQIRAVEWDKKNREHSFVLRGKDLTEGEQFVAGAAGKTPEVTPLQGEFILASRKDASRRQRTTMAGVVTALIVSIALGIAAFFSRQAAVAAQAEAETQRNNAVAAQKAAEIAQLQAEKEARNANAGRLALESENSLAQYPQRSLLLALEAAKVNQEANEPVRPDSEDALRVALEKMPGIGLTGFSHQVSLMQFTKDDRWLVAGTNLVEGEVKIWNFEKAISDPTYQPFYLSFPLVQNTEQAYEIDQFWLPQIYVSPQTHWLVLAGTDETQLWQIDDEDEFREPLTFSGKIEFTNLKDDNFIFENQGNQVIYWQIDPETLTKKELASFKGSLVTTSEDRKYLITDDAAQGLLLWNFGVLSSQATLLTEKHSSDFTYINISPNNNWLVLFENKPRPEYQIPKYDTQPPYNQIGTQAWNSTNIVLIPLGTTQAREFRIELDFFVDLYTKPKFSDDGSSFVYIGSSVPNEFGNPTGTNLGVLRFDEKDFVNLFSPTTESYSQISFIKENWLYLEAYDYVSGVTTGKLIDLREDELTPNVETSLPLLLDDNGNVVLTEDGSYIVTQSGNLINYAQLDLNQYISIETATQNSESQTSNQLAAELSTNYRELGMENYAIKTTQSSDGLWLAAGGYDGSVRVWDNQNPRVDSSLPTANPYTNYIALSNDNQWLAINGTLWQLKDGKPQKAYPFETETYIAEYAGYSNAFLSVFSPDSHWLIYLKLADSQTYTFSVNLIDLTKIAEKETVTSTKINSTDLVYTTVQFSPNSEWVLVGGDAYWGDPVDSFAYDLKNLKDYALQNASGLFKFTEDQKHIIFASGEKQDYAVMWDKIETWSLPDGTNSEFKKVGEVPIEEGTPILSQNGRWLLMIPTFSYGETNIPDSNLWDLSCIIKNFACKAFHLPAQNASFSPNSKYLITSNDENFNDEAYTIEIWDLQKSEPEKINSSQKKYVFPSVSQDGNLILFTKIPSSYSTSSTQTAGLFSSWAGYNSIGQNITTYDGYGHIFLGGGGGFAIGGYQSDYSVEAFNTSSLSSIALRGHESNISNSQMSPDGNYVITYSGSPKDDNGDPEKLLRLWNMNQMRLDRTTKPIVLPLNFSTSGDIRALAFSPDSKWIYVVDDKNILHYFPVSLEALEERACIALGRNLAISEWERFFPNAAYRKTCENLPEHPSAIAK